MPKNSSARTVVVAGGTDGMGRATALARLERGDTVVVVGRSAAKAADLADEARRLGAAERLDFHQADLSSIAAVREVIAHVAKAHPAMHALVLTANRQHLRRETSAEGLESTFALYYVSRYLLGHGLARQFDAAPDPVIINVAGPGTSAGSVNWDDPHLTRRYSTMRAQLQAGRANDLLAVEFAERPTSKARYVLYHPGFTQTAAINQFNQPLRAIVKVYARIGARSVADSAAPMIEWVENPPKARLTVDDRGKPVDLGRKMFDKANAARLAALTEELLDER
ncbi:SDR family NAD(P)-dependent oxidoreductase [Streptomyces sp. DSM 44915]|uniref:SDR family NAD(P)-dependent oxidoreductase n=1 Tax=Streptomyces chisholmiae TaxID=3075540 RepID=A0ABU2JXC6_9ACTN|nr:SDR family NAD(P)-dependent oxidoreductase [Streptomyces sp. DSM 44915]MDT0269652.1 SDR family NAD(P)-dependent oxidoreductase [Streptomyces sp. DSM 44915]